MICKGWRWQSHMGASVKILFFFGYFCGCLVLLQLLLIWQIFWRHNIFRRLGVIDYFLCDCPPATLYRIQSRRMILMLLWPALITWQSSLRRRGIFSSNQQACLQVSMEGTQNPKSFWAKMQWSMRWTPSLHGSLAYAGTKTEETPVFHCFNKQQLASGVAMGSMHEFGRHKAIMSKSHMSSCVTNEKVWKKPWPAENWLIQWVVQIFCGTQGYCPASQPQRGNVLFRAAVRYQILLGKLLDFYTLLYLDWYLYGSSIL